jgi:hypothetical protein
MKRRLPVLFLSASAVIACDSGPFGVNCTNEMSVELTPADITIVPGQTFTAAARILTCGGREELHYAPGQAPPLPAIDFSTRMLVLAAAGTIPAAGFFYHIAGATVQDDTLEVLVLERWPSAGTLPTLTSPVHVVSVPRVATAVRPAHQALRLVLR